MRAQKRGSIDDIKYLKIGDKYGFDIFSGGKDRVLKEIYWFVAKSRGFWQIATVNPEFVMKAKNDEKFVKILRSTGLNTIDGIGLVWADEINKFLIFNLQFSKWLIGRLVAGVAVGIGVLKGNYNDRLARGSELIVDISRLAKDKKWPVFFLGGFGDGAKLTGKKIDELVGGGLKYDVSQGRPDVSDTQVLLSIQKNKTKILFVAYGMKHQEEWIYENRKKLEKMGVRVAMGVGRTFDYYSGKVKMAPKWIKKMGLEWLYSLYKDPKRWRRQLVLPKFVWETIR